MFGRNRGLPVDLFFCRKGQDDDKSSTDYVDSLKKQLEYAYSLASAKAEKAGNVKTTTERFVDGTFRKETVLW